MLLNLFFSIKPDPSPFETKVLDKGHFLLLPFLETNAMNPSFCIQCLFLFYYLDTGLGLEINHSEATSTNPGFLGLFNQCNTPPTKKLGEIGQKL
jgi:hypothetical protein